MAKEKIETIGKVMLAIGVVLLILGFAFGATASALIGAGRHTPTDDSYVRSGYPSWTADPGLDVPFYMESTMLVQKHQTDEAMGYMKFDLSNLPSQVKSATLHLQYFSYEPGFDVELWSVTNDTWSGATLCWNNRPMETKKLGSAYISERKSYEWIEFDVTGYINSEVSGDGTASFAIGVPYFNDPKHTYIITKEWSEYRAPYLTYEGGTGTTYTLTTSVNPLGSGYVDPSGGTYDEGDSATLEATPAAGYEFSYWSGDASGTSRTTTITMDRDRSVTANFVQSTPMYTLSTSVEPWGSGSVVVNPLQDSYGEGTMVALTAIPATGYEFDRWSGDASGTAVSILVTMNSNKNITANFVETPPDETYTLATGVVRGDGIISPSTGTYAAGDEVEISAIATEGYSFHSWGGDLSGSENPATLVMNSDKHVTAEFDEILLEYVTLDMRASPTKGGSVAITGEVLPMGPAAFPRGTEVTIEAFPNEGWEFDYWSGDATGQEKAVTLLMDSDKIVTAHFTEKAPPKELLAGVNWLLVALGAGISGVGAILMVGLRRRGP